MIAQLDSHYIRTRPIKTLSRLISYTFFEGRPLTTRGRWINPLVFSFLKAAAKTPLLKKVIKPIFILGTGRSGTTILGRILSMHPEVGFLNEPKAIWHYLYPFEDLIGNYSRGAANYRLGPGEASQDVVEKAHRIYGAYLFSTFSNRVVDKYPELIFRIPFVKAIFPDAKFLFLVRNGWNTCHSIMKWSKNRSSEVDHERHDWWGVNNRKWKLIVSQLVLNEPRFFMKHQDIAALTRQVDMAAVEWIITMQEGLRALSTYPAETIQMLRYEDLLSQPKEFLSVILDFCELGNDAKVFEFALKSLKPGRFNNSVDLHPAIQAEFMETMHDMGYL